MLKGIIAFIFLTGFYSHANFQGEVPKGPTPEQEKEIKSHNQALEIESLRRRIPITIDTHARPFAEYEDNGYLIFNDEEHYESGEAKQLMAQNLPKDVTLLIYTRDTSKYYVEKIRNKYKNLIEPDRLKVVSIEAYGANSTFWARDGVPVPIIFNNSNALRLVDAKYYHNYEPDQKFANLFNAELMSHKFYFEGGNFMPNTRGDCITVTRNNLPTDEIFKTHYACKKIIRLPFVKGIGHVDESVKFMSDDVVVTDSSQYQEILTKAGYKVHMLPRPGNPYETYVNALNINGVLYLPVFGHANDEKAADVYRSFGLKVVPLKSSKLSNYGKGSIHCITMNYPKMNLNTLLEAMGAKLL